MFGLTTSPFQIILHLSLALATDSNTKAEAETLLKNVTLLENNSTSEQPIAEALIRYRRQPPRTIVKHIIRPKRFKMKRVKRPKIKYSFAEPPPAIYYSRKPISIKKPTFDSSIIEEFSHMNVESANFDLPPSSYESQSMDLDLYKHHAPAIETTYKEIQKPATYTYNAPEITFKETTKPIVTYSYAPPKTRKPHSNYGVPTEFVYTTGYENKPSDNKYKYEPPSTKPVYTEVEKPFYNAHGKNEYSYSKPSKQAHRIPATSYGVPDLHLPVPTGSNDYNKYSVVEQKPAHASYGPSKTETYHFAEPPQPESSIEITYSPSYEINIPPSNENSYSSGKYQPEHQPAYPPSYEEPSYQEPPQEYHPPTNYQPSNSYGSPPQGNYEHTGPSYQEGSDSNQPASYQPAPTRHESIDEYIPTSQELPINVNHKQPPYDYPKSSYEVPIYDPIPFDASSNQEREIYPPQTLDHTNRQQSATASEQRPESQEATPNEVHSSATRPQTVLQKPHSPINHLVRTRKRKRNNKGSSTTTSTTKHILDVPELEEAFEKENSNKYRNSREPDAHESHRVENINNQNKINQNYNSGPWNPMKIRTSSIMVTTPSSSSTSAVNALSTKNRRYHYKQQRSTTTSTTTTTEAPAKVEIISIEKSKSKSYYDGIVTTPKIYNGNFFRNRFRLHESTSTEQPQMKSTNENKLTKRTTKNIFDTTVFKSPLNDRDVYRNLPKNHKLF
ncbi:uncharacterized protein LOC135953720 [Calliphora vicina]|uniref:uncharacterized protein LOC135953720 n=1 Tax=Calliphora vicina TaxID=7373 RepID=UPI00325AD74C